MRNQVRRALLVACALATLSSAAAAGQSSEYGPPYPPGQGHPAPDDKSPRALKIRDIDDRYWKLHRLQDHPIVQEQLGRMRGDYGSFVAGHGRTLEEYWDARASIQACEGSRRNGDRDRICGVATRNIAVCVAKRNAWVSEKAAVINAGAGIDNKLVKTDLWLLNGIELLSCPATTALEGLTPDELLASWKKDEAAEDKLNACTTLDREVSAAIAAPDFPAADASLAAFKSRGCSTERATALQSDLTRARGPSKEQIKQSEIDKLVTDKLKAAEDQTKKDESAPKAIDPAAKTLEEDAAAGDETAKEKIALKKKLDTFKTPEEFAKYATALLMENKTELARTVLQAMVEKYPNGPATAKAAEQLVGDQEKDVAAAEAETAAAEKVKADEAAAKAAADAAANAPPPANAPSQFGGGGGGNRPAPPLETAPTTPPKTAQQCMAEVDAGPAAGRLNNLVAANRGDTVMILRGAIATFDLQIAAFSACGNSAQIRDAIAQSRAQRDGAIKTCQQIASQPSLCTVSPWGGGDLTMMAASSDGSLEGTFEVQVVVLVAGMRDDARGGCLGASTST